jgi:succinate dehydrogenase / fumarate reductase flavoprotein subunit
VCDEGRGVGPTGRGVYLDFAESIDRLGEETIRKRYGNLFDMYQRITGDNPCETPMRIYPAPHYAMGGLWVDYNLMSNVPGLFVIGEANFSDHGANRLGASALMQGLADGYFILPYTIGDYLADVRNEPIDPNALPFKEAAAETHARIDRLLSGNGKRTPTSFHRELGDLMIEACGMTRSESGLRDAIARIPEIREQFYQQVAVPASGCMATALEYAGRVADFLEFAELMCYDALARDESCGAHFRVEHQTSEGEAARDDERFFNVSAWEFNGIGQEPILHVEPLAMQNVKLAVRNYQ